MPRPWPWGSLAVLWVSKRPLGYSCLVWGAGGGGLKGHPPLPSSFPTAELITFLSELDPFGDTSPSCKQNGMKDSEALDLGVLGEALQPGKEARPCRTPESFLGPSASSLVNLDSLVKTPLAARTRNPFLTGRTLAWCLGPRWAVPLPPPLQSPLSSDLSPARRSGCSVPDQPVWRGRAGQADSEPDAHRLARAGSADGTRRGALGLHDLQRLLAPPAQ